MTIQPIKTKKDYETALKKIDELFDAKPNTPDGDLLDVLVTLVEAYEQEHSNIAPPIRFIFRSKRLNLPDARRVQNGADWTETIRSRRSDGRKK